jgi:hypothetical protein
MAGLSSCRIRASNGQVVCHAGRHFALFLSLGKEFFRPGTRNYLAFGFARRPPRPISAIADFG